jgi:ribonuclease P protein subunit RPR2
MAQITTIRSRNGKLKSKGSGNVPNKALHSRVSYLYQAATYLATQQQQYSKVAVESCSNSQSHSATDTTKAEMRPPSTFEASLMPASRRLISDLCTVSLKGQMRLSPAMKHTLCKNCDTLLIDGSSCTSELENKSKGRKKRWADILVRKCDTCGTARRYPVAAKRQRRRPQRLVQDLSNIQEVDAAGG